jgi:ribonuclease BN (tRNA processing enzyme)
MRDKIEITFLGTRGEINVSSRRHRRHSALLIARRGSRIMLDCGADWLGRLRLIAPTAIILTHAHLDHAGGLADGAPCPVYATSETLRLLREFPIRNRRRVPLTRALTVGGIEFRAYRVQHSLRAPTVGYRVSSSAGVFFYLPDVADLPSPASALRGVDVYVGDGATLTRPIVRIRDGVRIGHAPVAVQLGWCSKAGVRKAIFTHCGSPIVRADGRTLNATIRKLGREHGVDASIACDGERLLSSRAGRRKRLSTENFAKRRGRTRRG